MATPTKRKKKSYRRGNSEHYADLARKSVDSRIKRHIEVEFLTDPTTTATVPIRKRETDAGYDVFSPSKAVIRPGATETILLGLRCKCPPGYFFEIRGRSSLNNKGIVITDNVVDATYTGQLRVRLINNSGEIFTVNPGDRIAQLIFLPQIHVKFRKVQAFKMLDGERGDAGFGSTGN